MRKKLTLALICNKPCIILSKGYHFTDLLILSHDIHQAGNQGSNPRPKTDPKKFFALCHFLAFCQFLWVYIDHLSEDFEKLFMAMLVLFLEIAFLIPNVDFRIRRQFFHYFSSLMYRFNQNKPSGA